METSPPCLWWAVQRGIMAGFRLFLCTQRILVLFLSLSSAKRGSSPLVLLRAGAWVKLNGMICVSHCITKWVTVTNGLSQLQIKEHKLLPSLFILNSLLHFIAEHVWEEKMHKRSSLMITATKGGSDLPNLSSDAVLLHYVQPRLPLAMATSTWRVRHFLWLF